jgi:hypothetical protein
MITMHQSKKKEKKAVGRDQKEKKIRRRKEKRGHR